MECVCKKKDFFLGEKEYSTWNMFANVELDLEFFVQEGQGDEGIST